MTSVEVKQLVDACNRKRDKLIILMLYETGMRKGELLGLRHEDIGDYGDNKISIIKRENINGARVKGGERIIPVSRELIQIYNDYLIDEYPEVNSDYVFINIWSGEIGRPINYKALNQLFRQLEKKTGIKAYQHLFRHTYTKKASPT